MIAQRVKIGLPALQGLDSACKLTVAQTKPSMQESEMCESHGIGQDVLACCVPACEVPPDGPSSIVAVHSQRHAIVLEYAPIFIDAQNADVILEFVLGGYHSLAQPPSSWFLQRCKDRVHRIVVRRKTRRNHVGTRSQQSRKASYQAPHVRDVLESTVTEHAP